MAKHHIELTSQDVAPIDPRPFPCWTKRTLIWENANRQNTPQDCYRACTVGVGIADHICPVEARITTFQYALQKAELRDCQWQLSNSASGRVSGLPPWSVHILDVRRQFWIQKKGDGGLGKWRLHFPMECADFYECRSVWRVPRARSNVQWTLYCKHSSESLRWYTWIMSFSFQSPLKNIWNIYGLYLD